jgi:hypothetical protein
MYDFGVLLLKLTAEWTEGNMTLSDASLPELSSDDRFIGAFVWTVYRLRILFYIS